MGLFSKKKPKPDKSSTRNSAFFLRENHITNIEEFMRAMHYYGEEDSFTDTINGRLSFAGMILKDITMEDALDKLEKPAFVLDNSENIPGHTVYFYRQNADLFKFLVQLHFVDNQCVFVRNKISISGITLSDSEKSKIIDKLFTKYGVKKERGDKLLVSLKDIDGSVLFTIDTVHFYLNYVVSKKYTGSIIDKLSKIDFTKEEEKGFDEVFGKLI
jgi:hypothetical protein